MAALAAWAIVAAALIAGIGLLAYLATDNAWAGLACGGAAGAVYGVRVWRAGRAAGGAPDAAMSRAMRRQEQGEDRERERRRAERQEQRQRSLSDKQLAHERKRSLQRRFGGGGGGASGR